ncbi:response regulator transcription factor [Streptomyces pathocidini]|uniref:Response regulator n=1 Tax=Streptomyces pathocidini TaxID=1650571 RepID=A0ABW7UQ98_9ACTN|nr:response regulator transcription factor [Streptomyces pathocidini]
MTSSVLASVTNVLVVDDSEIVRRGLTDVIDSSGDLYVIAEAWNGHSAVDAARRCSPDVVLMDVRMPGMDGLTATRELRALGIPPHVIVLTMFGEDDYVDEAVRAGASGFLLKDTPPEELLRAIRQVAAGNAMLDPAVTSRILHTLADQGPRVTNAEEAALAGLTTREVDVLRLVARGLSNADIGAQLHSTEGTVKGQVSRLLTKLGVDNRVQAARLAYRSGLER